MAKRIQAFAKKKKTKKNKKKKSKKLKASHINRGISNVNKQITNINVGRLHGDKKKKKHGLTSGKKFKRTEQGRTVAPTGAIRAPPSSSSSTGGVDPKDGQLKAAMAQEREKTLLIEKERANTLSRLKNERARVASELKEYNMKQKEKQKEDKQKLKLLRAQESAQRKREKAAKSARDKIEKEQARLHKAEALLRQKLAFKAAKRKPDSLAKPTNKRQRLEDVDVPPIPGGVGSETKEGKASLIRTAKEVKAVERRRGMLNALKASLVNKENEAARFRQEAKEAADRIQQEMDAATKRQEAILADVQKQNKKKGSMKSIVHAMVDTLGNNPLINIPMFKRKGDVIDTNLGLRAASTAAIKAAIQAAPSIVSGVANLAPLAPAAATYAASEYMMPGSGPLMVGAYGLNKLAQDPYMNRISPEKDAKMREEIERRKQAAEEKAAQRAEAAAHQEAEDHKDAIIDTANQQNPFTQHILGTIAEPQVGTYEEEKEREVKVQPEEDIYSSEPSQKLGPSNFAASDIKTRGQDEGQNRPGLRQDVGPDQYATGRNVNKTGVGASEINKCMRRYRSKGFKGAISRDEIPMLQFEPKSRLSAVINLDPHDEPGSHWVALYIDARDGDGHGHSHSIEYFDPYGDPMPADMRRDLQAIYARLNPDQMLMFKENRIKKQRENSGRCGLLSMKFIINRVHGKPFVESSGFTTDVLKSEKEVKNYPPFRYFNS